MEWGFGSARIKVKEESRRMLSLCMKRARSIGHTEYVRTAVSYTHLTLPTKA